jgi:hypothetical protein
MSLPIPARMPPRFKPLADLLDGHMVNAKVLSARWSTSTQTLANWRSTGKGLPAVSLAEGAVRYRISEILAAELAGARGPLSVETVALELSVMPDVPEALAVKIVERLRAVMADPARISRPQ